jgi:Ca2+-binding RTX toxin-like protein
VGTDRKDTMTGRDGRTDDVRAKGGADEVRGRGGADTLSGGPGADTLTGALGKDTLAGAEGPDALKGGSADDTYKFGINDWGKDTITDTPSSDTDPDTGNFAEFGSPDRFLSTRLTINLTSSASSPEVSNGTLTGTVNWPNNAIDGVYVGSITDDTITGNSAANTIVSNIGPDSDDTIDAGAGNDWISVLDFAGGDTVDCGDGVDTLFADTGNPDDKDTLISC